MYIPYTVDIYLLYNMKRIEEARGKNYYLFSCLKVDKGATVIYLHIAYMDEPSLFIDIFPRFFAWTN
jgi:hypothetical protein